MIAFGMLVGLSFPPFAKYVLEIPSAMSAPFALLSILPGVLGGVVNYILFKMLVVREIRRVVKGMEDVNRDVAAATEGHEICIEDQHLKITSNDELGTVAMSFNKMTAAISRRLRVERGARHLLSSLAHRVDLREAGEVVLKEIASTFEASAGVLYANTDGRFERLCSSGADITGKLPEHIDSSLGPVKRAIQSGEIHEIRPDEEGLDWIELSTPLGSFRPRLLLLVPLSVNDGTAGLVVLACGASELSEEQLERLQLIRGQASPHLQNAILHQKVEELAAVDELTGLANRRTGMQDLQKSFSTALREGTPLSIVMLDIDHFKSLNDTHGHDAGDAVLKVVADILQENTRIETSTRAGDTLCRYGGEEFLIAAPNTGMDGIKTVTERIRAQIEAMEIQWHNRSLQISASLGVTTWPVVRASTPEELVTLADKALYRAKQSGRNQVCVNTGDDIQSQRKAA